MKSNHKTFKNMNQFINNQIFGKMKKSLIFTVLMALAMSGLAQQYHFAATCESGQTLYYRITDAEAHTVILTHPVSQNYIWFQGNYYGNFAQPQGEVVLPSIVNYHDVDYYVTAIDSCTFGNVASHQSSFPRVLHPSLQGHLLIVSHWKPFWWTERIPHSTLKTTPLSEEKTKPWWWDARQQRFLMI